MLKYKVGNLITAAQTGEISVLCHQANCFHAMAAGIAPQIAKAFPEAEEADFATIKGDKFKLGHNSFASATITKKRWWWRNTSEHLLLVNMYGQYGTGGVATDYKALRSCINSLAEDLSWTIWSGGMKIGMPKIGCGLGGGDWSIVEKIIEEELHGFDVTIYVLKAEDIQFMQDKGDVRW